MAVCALRLQAIMDGKRLVIDDQFRIVGEYQNKIKPNTGNRVGDGFVKWALRNIRITERVHRVGLIAHSQRGFETFPDDEELAKFDKPDRKFVAVACAHGDFPPILQATDSKWLGWNDALRRHGVIVEFICRDDVERFHAQKTKTSTPATARRTGRKKD